MTRQRERTVISHISLVISPRLAEVLDDEARTQVGDTIWMCAYWALLESRLVGHNSDVTHHIEWLSMMRGSNPYVDLNIKAVTQGFTPDTMVKAQLNRIFREKLVTTLPHYLRIPAVLQARFVWGYVMSTQTVEPAPEASKRK